MEWKDIIPVLAGGLVILVVALVVKPALRPGDRPRTDKTRVCSAHAGAGGDSLP